MEISEISNTELLSLYILAEKMHVKAYQRSKMNSENEILKNAFARLTKIEEEINKRLMFLD